MPTPKYSISELERRFLLPESPPGVSAPRRIHDLYVYGTRLRLRRVEDLTSGDVELKLGHKRRLNESDPGAIYHTSLYLSAAEYGVLATLAGQTLVKIRWTVDVDGRRAAIDVFEGELGGLVMLEVDFHTHEERVGFSPPPWAGQEVTHREEFSGGALSGTTNSDLAELLATLDPGIP